MSLCMCCQRDSGCCRKLSWVKRAEADGAADERAAIINMLDWNGAEERSYSDEWKRCCRALAEELRKAPSRGEPWKP